MTLDASLTFPIILLLTFMLLFFAIYIAQGAIVYYSASIEGERAAYNWNNSAKDLHTGAYPEGSFDGLYWRMLDDAVLTGLFGMGAQAEAGVAFGIGHSEAGAGDSLSKTKLEAAASPLNASLNGQMIYTNKLLERQIVTEAESTAVPEPLRNFHPASELSAKTSAVVVDPVEFMRSFDLVRYYGAKLKGTKDGEGSFLSKARSILLRRQRAN